jgi:hypothetical protein
MKTRLMTKEEFEALSKDLQTLLIKHNAEIGVSSKIELLKREEIISPFLVKDDGKENNTTEEGQKT